MTSKTNHPAVYRASQFFVAVKACLPVWIGGINNNLFVANDTLFNTILPTPAQQTLFNQMSPNDQRHALAVARTLQEAGHTNLALLQAALLHDVGKSLGQPIVHRVLIVLFNAFWPAALQELSQVSGEVAGLRWWRRPFVVHAQHPAIGATWATEAECDPLAITLIARHQEKLVDTSTEEQKLLAALQWADDLN